jgi:hypothetical protein
VKLIRLILPIILIAFCAEAAWSQSSSFQRRKAVQKQRFKKSTARFGKACEIFEKKRIKGEKRPLISLGLNRGKRKTKMAEQN